MGEQHGDGASAAADIEHRDPTHLGYRCEGRQHHRVEAGSRPVDWLMQDEAAAEELVSGCRQLPGGRGWMRHLAVSRPRSEFEPAARRLLW